MFSVYRPCSTSRRVERPSTRSTTDGGVEIKWPWNRRVVLHDDARTRRFLTDHRRLRERFNGARRRDTRPTSVDAGLHLMERCTGRLVDCKKEEIFIITYCATGRRSLGRHTDGDGKRTLLITLDASRDYAGGGTRFYPKEASAPSFVVRPARGAAVAFDGSVEHEGEAVVGGRRHVVVVFATEVDDDERDDHPRRPAPSRPERLRRAAAFPRATPATSAARRVGLPIPVLEATSPPTRPSVC